MMYFKNCGVGDKVWDYVHGTGTIICIDDGWISVRFGGSPTVGMQFNENGFAAGDNQRLFYYEERPIVITKDDFDLSSNNEYAIFCDMWFCNAKDNAERTFKTLSFNRTIHKLKEIKNAVKYKVPLEERMYRLWGNDITELMKDIMELSEKNPMFNRIFLKWLDEYEKKDEGDE